MQISETLLRKVIKWRFRWCFRKEISLCWGWLKITRIRSPRHIVSMVYKVCTSLNARLPKSVFVLKVKTLYVDWLQQHADTPEEVKLHSPANGSRDGNKNTARIRQQEFPCANQISAVTFQGMIVL